MPAFSLGEPGVSATGVSPSAAGASLVSVSTIGSSASATASASVGLCHSTGFAASPFFLAKILVLAGSLVHATPSPCLASRAVIFQYSSVLNASISRSRSTISLTATDCTRPALSRPATFLPSRFESGKPTTRSSARRASWAATRSVSIFSGFVERGLHRRLGDLVEPDAESAVLRQVQLVGDVPGDRLALAVGVAGEQYAVGLRGLALHLGENVGRCPPLATAAWAVVLAAVVHDVAEFPPVGDVDAGDGVALLLCVSRSRTWP